MARRSKRTFARIALVLPTEYAYARAVMRGIISATRERNMYAQADTLRGTTTPDGSRSDLQRRPWLFNVFRGIYGHSSKYLERWFKDWNPDGIICQIYSAKLANVYRQTRKPVVELFESRIESEFPRILPDDLATGELAARHFLERGFKHFAFFGATWMLWSREREVGFKREIERAFRMRGDASRRLDGSAPFTFGSYSGFDVSPALPAFGSSQKE